MELYGLFSSPKPVIGMLHIPALPGSPQSALPFEAIVDWVIQDAETLKDGGIDGLVIENFGDTPFYPGPVPGHTVAFMTALAREVRHQFSIPLGINVLRNDAASALAVAAASGAQFIRVNIHTGARLTDQGMIEGRAHETLRYRQLLGAGTKIFADIDVKHSAPVAARELTDEVEEIVSRGCADAVIVTGSATGKQTAAQDLRTAKAAAGLAPIIAGSGVNVTNVAAILQIADAVIVGTALKRDGITTNPVDLERVRAFMNAIRNS